MTTQIQLKRGTAARWTALNPVLAAGEPGWESDTGRRKTGDGVTAWSALPYQFDKAAADALYALPANVVPNTAKGAANGVATLDGSLKIPQAQIPAMFVPKWQPTTVYAAGDQVVSPTNEVLTATAHTSGASFDATKWTNPNPKARGLIAQTYTGGSTTGLSGVTVADLAAVSLVAGRRYRLAYRFTSVAQSAASNALQMNPVKSVTTDATTSGTSMDDAAVVWTAPSSVSSSMHLLEWSFVAAATETVNLKVTLQRVVGASLIDISQRRLKIYDDGAQF